MAMPESFSVIADLPPRDGREWDNQCARCGSSVTLEERDCLSSADWCEAHPIAGREDVPRGSVEWFTFDAPKAGST